MNYAIIEDGIVVNTTVSNHQVAANWAAVPTGCPVAIGDSYDGLVFKSPAGEMRMPPETAAVASMLEALIGGVEDA